MMTRRGSQVAFTFVVISAAAMTCIILYTLVARFSLIEALTLGFGSLLVLWAILFSFYEVQRIVRRSKGIGGDVLRVDPDAPRKVMVEPPTGDPYPHHEFIEGSCGFDQGQLTSRSPDLPPLRELFYWPWRRKTP